MGRRGITPRQRFCELVRLIVVVSILFFSTGCEEGDISQFLASPDLTVRSETEEIPTNGTIDFGTLHQNDSKDITITINNDGNQELVFSGEPPYYTIEGDDASLFSITGQLPEKLGIGESLDIIVTCTTVNQSGPISATLTIVSNDTATAEDDEADSTGAYSIELIGVVSSESQDTTAPSPGATGTITVDAVVSTTVSLSWSRATDETTDQVDLQYKVVYSSSNTIETVGDAETYGTTVVNWSADLTQDDITLPNPETAYYVNVMVKDSADNSAVYRMVQVTTGEETPDTTLPSPGGDGTITVTSVGEASIGLEWVAASDDRSNQADLQYIVYYSKSSNIGTYANAQTNGTEVGLWTKNKLDVTVSLLDGVTTFYFNVFVRDEAGNIASYGVVSETTVDATMPVPGNEGAITANAVSAQQIDLTWQKATDNVTAEADLRYKVVYSTTADIYTIDDIETNGYGIVATGPEWTLDLGTLPITGLTEATVYYVNVLVKDQAGNIAVYGDSAITATTFEAIDPFTVTFVEPGDETILLNQTDDQVFTGSDSIIASITEQYAGYEWYLDGDAMNQYGQSVTLDFGSLSLTPGQHTLTAYVKSDGTWYSKILWFKITS